MATNRKRANDNKWYRVVSFPHDNAFATVNASRVYQARGGKGKAHKCPIAKALRAAENYNLAQGDKRHMKTWGKHVTCVGAEVEKSRAYTYYSDGTCCRFVVPVDANRALSTFDTTGIMKDADFQFVPVVAPTAAEIRAKEQIRAYKRIVTGFAPPKPRKHSRRLRRGMSDE